MNKRWTCLPLASLALNAGLSIAVCTLHPPHARHMFATHDALVCHEGGHPEHGEPVPHAAFLPAASVQMAGVSTHTTIGPITVDGITFWFVPEG